MNETSKNGGLINNDNQPQVSKELKSNKMKVDKRTNEYRNWEDERTKELQLQIDDFKKDELIDYVIEIDESYEEHIENLMDNDLIDIIIEHEQTIN
jgi:hypothetical protein